MKNQGIYMRLYNPATEEFFLFWIQVYIIQAINTMQIIDRTTIKDM